MTDHREAHNVTAHQGYNDAIRADGVRSRGFARQLTLWSALAERQPSKNALAEIEVAHDGGSQEVA